MTDRELMQQALEALKLIDEAMPFPVAKLTIKNLSERLAQPEREPDDIASILACRDMLDAQPVPPRTEQEPVGQLLEEAYGRGQVMWFNKPKDQSMLYTIPPQRTWVGLDEVEIVGCTCECIDVGELNMNCAIDFARAIEAKLKELNT